MGTSWLRLRDYEVDHGPVTAAAVSTGSATLQMAKYADHHVNHHPRARRGSIVDFRFA
jgi:hypothetical protein